MAQNIFHFWQFNNMSRMQNPLPTTPKTSTPATLNFWAPMSWATNFQTNIAPKVTIPWQQTTSSTPNFLTQNVKPQPTASLKIPWIEQVNASEDKNLLQQYLEDTTQDNESKKEVFRALQDWVDENELINHLQTSWYTWQQPTQEKPWFIWWVKESITNRLSNIWEWILRPQERPETISKNPIVASLQPLWSAIWQVWQVAGAVWDVGFEWIKALTPDFIKESLKSTWKALWNSLTPETQQTAVNAIQQWWEIYSQFKQENPYIADTLEWSANIASLLPIWKAGQVWVKTSEKVVEKWIKWVQKVWEKLWAFTSIEQKITKADTQTIDKIRQAIRPSITWVDTAWKFDAQSDKLLQWVKEVVNQWFVPKNTKQAMEAINESKQKVWQQVQEANRKVNKITTWDEIAQEIYNFTKNADNDALFRANPELEWKLVQYADSIKENPRFSQLTQDDLQELLTNTNQKIPANSFAKQLDSNPIETQKNTVLASLLRDKVENNLMDTIWTSSQELRNKYWALRQLEKDLAKRYWVFARQNPKWLADLFWAEAIPEIAMGIITGNIWQVAKWVFTKWVIQTIKNKNNPNNIIKDIFKTQSKIKWLKAPLQTEKKAQQILLPPWKWPNAPIITPQTTEKWVILESKKWLSPNIKPNETPLPTIKKPSENWREVLKPKTIKEKLQNSTTFQKLWDKIDEYAEKTGARKNLLPSKQWIWEEKTALLKWSDNFDIWKRKNFNKEDTWLYDFTWEEIILNWESIWWLQHKLKNNNTLFIDNIFIKKELQKKGLWKKTIKWLFDYYNWKNWPIIDKIELSATNESKPFWKSIWAKEIWKDNPYFHWWETRMIINKQSLLPVKESKVLKPSVSDNLINEAKKYKSFDEFKKSQWEELYHWTPVKFNEFDLKNFWKSDAWYAGKWIYLTDNKEIAREYADTWTSKAYPTERKWYIINSYINIKKPLIVKDYEELFKKLNATNKTTSDELTNIAKKKWYDSFLIKHKSNDWRIANEYVIFDTKNIKTESQLKQIYEQAKKSK